MKLLLRTSGAGLVLAFVMLQTIYMLRGMSFLAPKIEHTSWIFWKEWVSVAPQWYDLMSYSFALSCLWFFRFTEEPASITSQYAAEARASKATKKTGEAVHTKTTVEHEVDTRIQTQSPVATHGNISEAEATRKANQAARAAVATPASQH